MWPWDWVGFVHGARGQPGRRLGVNWTHAQEMQGCGCVLAGVTSRFTLFCCSFPSPSRTCWGARGPQGHLDTEDPPKQKSQCKEWAPGGVRCHARPWRWQNRGREAGREAPMEAQTGDGQMIEERPSKHRLCYLPSGPFGARKM